MLGVLIVIAFFALIYGMYTKISSKSLQIDEISKKISIFLESDEEIQNFEVIDQKNLLITIKKNDELIGLIYDIDNNRVVKKISK